MEAAFNSFEQQCGGSAPVGGAGRTGRLTRASLLRRLALGASATSAVGVVGLSLPGPAASAPSAAQDRAILNFALMLERIQEAFYAEALRRGSLQGELREFVDTVGGQERAHVKHLLALLGTAADAPPKLQLASVTADPDSVRTTAVALEDIVLGGYNGQAPNLTHAGLRAVLPIVSVEARHAGWIRDLAGDVPAPTDVDPLPSEQQVRAQLHRAGILVEAP